MNNKEYLKSYKSLYNKMINGEVSVIECLNKRLNIENSIIDLQDGLESLIIHKKYIQFFYWDKICHDLQLSRRQVMRIHNMALKNIKIENSKHA